MWFRRRTTNIVGVPVANCVNNAISVVSDDFIPENYESLYDAFSPFVTRLVTRYNRVTSNFEDLLQHVWLKLVEVDVIHKYNTSSSLPKRLTGKQFASVVGMEWPTLKRHLHRFHLGVSCLRLADNELLPKINKRDNGVCSSCGNNTKLLERSLDIVRANPNGPNARNIILNTQDSNSPAIDSSGLDNYALALKITGLSPGHKNLWYAVKTSKLVLRGAKKIDHFDTVCFLCMRKKYPTGTRVRSGWAPTPIEGKWSSQKALYAREDAERFITDRKARGIRVKNTSKIKHYFRSKPFFKLYLAKSVHNIYANWCRTRARRYKEHFPGTDPETGRSWEDTLVDSTRANQETLSELYEAIRILVNDKIGACNSVHEEVIVLLTKGYSPDEIVDRMGLPKRGLRTLALGA